jgi:sterol desaturase/sphingolipid hydroxylase (fatty acid hydroxylase superfamily)
LPGLYGIFIHWNTPWRMNAIAKWVVTPWYHRIHHSTQPEHHNKNYAVFFPFWDFIFGSAYFAKAHEYPDTGIVSRLPPNSLQRLLPFPHQ